MSEYGYQINLSFFNHEMYDKLVEFSCRRITEHLSNTGEILPDYIGTSYTGIKFYNNAITHLPNLQQLMDDCNLSILISPSMGFVPPGKFMGVHADGYGCKTKILLPILPINILSDLHFYNNLTDKLPVVSIPTVSGVPIVFNCEKLHGGINTGSEWRANLQLKFAEPFEYVVELMHQSTLFKTIHTSIINY